MNAASMGVLVKKPTRMLRPEATPAILGQQAAARRRQIVVFIVSKKRGRWQLFVPLFGEQMAPVLSCATTIERQGVATRQTAADYAAAVFGLRAESDKFDILYESPRGTNGAVVHVYRASRQEVATIRLGYGEPYWWALSKLLEQEHITPSMHAWLYELREYLAGCP